MYAYCLGGGDPFQFLDKLIKVFFEVHAEKMLCEIGVNILLTSFFSPQISRYLASFKTPSVLVFLLTSMLKFFSMKVQWTG